MNEIRNYFLDFLFPRYCLRCQILLTDLRGWYVCSSCLKTISLKSGFACPFCLAPVPAGKVCPFCKPNHYLDRLLAATSYGQPLVETMLKAMKYRFAKSLADQIGSVMIKYLKSKLISLNFEVRPPLVIGVPLHPRRLNWRGFNQSEILAEKIGKRFGWPLAPEILARKHNRKPQADIEDKKTRIENMINVFNCGNQQLVTGKRILLIDDVATTSSTLNDCARALKGAGAVEIIGFVFARNSK